MRRLGTGTGFAARSCPRSFRSASVARFGQDDGKDWMRRLGTGTGFACAKLSEVLPRSERSLATVRMTEKDWMRRFGAGTGFAARRCPRSFRVASFARFGQDDKKRVRRHECGAT